MAVARAIAEDDIATIMDGVDWKSERVGRRYAGRELALAGGRSASSGQKEPEVLPGTVLEFQN